MSNLLMMNNPRPDQGENLEILKFSANNLLAIVNDVLDFNKIESGKVVFENIRFNMVELMKSICGGQVIKAEEKGLTFKLDVARGLNNKILIGDPTRITFRSYLSPLHRNQSLQQDNMAEPGLDWQL
jgi:signal transduction histidine kinase